MQPVFSDGHDIGNYSWDYFYTLGLNQAPGEDPRPDRATSFTVVLINPYELGRQPFALAEPCAWLKRAGFDVRCIDLSLQ